MKILVLDEFLFYPPDSGKKIRSYNILVRMAKIFDITLMVYVWGDDKEARGLAHLKNQGIKVVTVNRENPQKSGFSFYTRLLVNLFSSLPYIVDGHDKPAYRNCLNRLLSENNFDLVIAEWSPYAVFFNQLKNIPGVAVAHNLEQEIWRGYVNRTSNPLKKWYLNHQYQKVAAFENNIFNHLSGLITVSPLEQEYIEKEYPALASILIENGVDLNYFAPVETDDDDRLLTFVGSMNWRPNQDGVEYFINEILPLVKLKLKDVKVQIVGHSPPAGLVKLGEKHGVHFTGSVDDVRPYVQQAAIEIVPLLIGGGSRLKIVEAFSMKKAVVSTSKGAEGLSVTHNHDIMIADCPDDFAKAIVELSHNPEKRKMMGENGRKLVEEFYNWDNIVIKQQQFLEGLIK